MNSHYRFAGLLTLATLSVLPAAATARDRAFDEIVHRLESHFHKRPVRFMGLASFVANRAKQEGVRHMRIAVFEGLDRSSDSFNTELDTFLQQTAQPEFQPFVRVRSNRDGEQTYVFAREAGEDWKLLVVSLEHDEASVIEMQLKPEAMNDWFDEPADKAKHSARDADREP